METATQQANTDHVVLVGATMTCRHCGRTYTMNLPCPILIMAAASKAFSASHMDCPPPAAKETPCAG